jgi:hypothetical protein
MKLHHRLKCHAQTLQYDFKTRGGTVHAAGCTDMRGAIELFEAIDPEVVEIRTFMDGRPDTLYWHDHETWRAEAPDENSQIVVVSMRGAA